MSVSEVERRAVNESAESMTLDPGTSEFHLEPRCRICRNDQVRTTVNGLLATGASYAQIVRALVHQGVERVEYRVRLIDRRR